MITNHLAVSRGIAPASTTSTTAPTGLDRIAEAAIPYTLTPAALAALEAEAAPQGTRPMQRAEWAVRLPAGKWYRDGIAADEPTVYRTRAAAEFGAAHMIATAEIIAATDYVPTLYVRPVVIDGTYSARIGAWTPARGA